MAGKPIKHRGKWRIRWKDADGTRRSEVYDDFRDAALQLKRHELNVEEIRRGNLRLGPPKKTIGELCDEWLKRRADKRSADDDASMIGKHLRPFFGKVLLTEFNPAHVDSYVESRSAISKKTINNHLTLLIAMLNLAKRDLRWLVDVPYIRKLKLPHESEHRYLKSDEEIARFLRSARAIGGEQVHAMYATAVYTGMRAGELAGLRWDCVNFDQRLMVVQRSYDGPTKGNDTRHVPILDPLLSILKEQKHRNLGDFVFPNARGNMHDHSARIFQEVFHRALQHAGFPESVKKNGRVKRYIVFHDLRHTFASHWMMNGGNIYRLQSILGHKSVTMTERYAHLAPDVFAEDYARLGSHTSPDAEAATNA